MKKNEMVFSSKKGVLLAFEGISGSGKSEGIVKLSRRLQSEGHVVTVVEWNSNQMIRGAVKAFHRVRMLTPFVYSVFQWISFFIDYCIVIIPALKKGHIVIADRYVYTALTRDAVNGAYRPLGRMLHRLARVPDWILLYDTSPGICHERIKNRGKALFHPNTSIHRNKRIENKELYYLSKMRDEYISMLSELNLEGKANVVVVNNEWNDLHIDLEQYIDQKMGNSSYRFNHS